MYIHTYIYIYIYIYISSSRADNTDLPDSPLLRPSQLYLDPGRSSKLHPVSAKS